MSKNKKMGRPRKWEYKGERKPLSIRLTEKEKKMILTKFESISEFIAYSVGRLK